MTDHKHTRAVVLFIAGLVSVTALVLGLWPSINRGIAEKPASSQAEEEGRAQAGKAIDRETRSKEEEGESASTYGEEIEYPAEVRIQVVSNVTGKPLPNWVVAVGDSDPIETDDSGMFAAEVEPGEDVALWGGPKERVERLGVRTMEGVVITREDIHRYLRTEEPIQVRTTGGVLGYVKIFRRVGDRKVQMTDLSGSVGTYHDIAGLSDELWVPRKIEDGYFVWYEDPDYPGLSNKRHRVRFELKRDLVKQWRIVEGETVTYPGDGRMLKHSIVVAERKPTTVSFLVVGGEPERPAVSGASVQLKPLWKNGSWIQLEKTDANGRTRADQLRPGEYRIKAAAKGYFHTPEDVILGQDPQPTRLLLTPTVTVAVDLSRLSASDPPYKASILQWSDVENDYFEFTPRNEDEKTSQKIIEGVPVDGTSYLFVRQGMQIVSIQDVDAGNDTKVRVPDTNDYPNVRVILEVADDQGETIPLPNGTNIQETSLIYLDIRDYQTGVPMFSKTTDPTETNKYRGIKVVDRPFPPRKYIVFAINGSSNEIYRLGMLDLSKRSVKREYIFKLKLPAKHQRTDELPAIPAFAR